MILEISNEIEEALKNEGASEDITLESLGITKGRIFCSSACCH